jgi:hypothetical protein
MQPDPELEAWRRQWQADRSVPPDLQRRVEREIRAARRGVIVSIAVTLIFGIAIPLRAWLAGRPEDLVLAVGVVVFIALTWATSLRITRGAQKPAGATTAAFLDFSILSCRRTLAGITAGAILYVIFLAFIIGVNYRGALQESPIGLWPYLMRPRNLVVWAVTAVIGAVVWRRRRLCQRELRNLLEIRRSSRFDV